jgi:hypothetical protein
MVTAGQARALFGVLAGTDFTAIEGAFESHFMNVADDAILGEDALALIAVFFPQAAILAEAAPFVIALAPIALANVQPDPDPIHDAQLDEGRVGRGPR